MALSGTRLLAALGFGVVVGLAGCGEDKGAQTEAPVVAEAPAPAPEPAQPDQAAFDAAYAVAEAAFNESVSARNAWVTAQKELAAAKGAAAAGDFAAGIQHAGEARAQSELALAQKAHEADNWQKSVIQ
jgi:hypothetical protein